MYQTYNAKMSQLFYFLYNTLIKHYKVVFLQLVKLNVFD